MPSAINSPSQSASASKAEEQPSLDNALADICRQVLSYARQAKVQRFRYCRNPQQSHSPHKSLGAAIDALETELKKAASQPVCQTQAIEFLRQLASFSQQPPCENSAQQKAAALTIHSALLDLR